MKEDLVSVIIPVFNTKDYVESCIESVVNQTYHNIEIIVVNDGSTDGSLEVLRKWESIDCRIRVIDKINEGVSIARNVAIDEAKGNYIMFLDSDDWLRNDAIKWMYRTIKKEDSDIVICGICQIWENRTNDCKVLDSGEKTIYTEKMGDRFLNDSIAYSSVNKLYKKSCIDLYRFPYIRICEDAVFNRRVFRNTRKVTFISDCLYMNRQRSNSATKQRIDNVLIDEHFRAINEMRKIIFETWEGQAWKMSPQILLFELTTAVLLNGKVDNLVYLTKQPDFYCMYRQLKLDSFSANCKKMIIYILLKLRCFSICMGLARIYQRGVTG